MSAEESSDLTDMSEIDTKPAKKVRRVAGPEKRGTTAMAGKVCSATPGAAENGLTHTSALLPSIHPICHHRSPLPNHSPLIACLLRSCDQHIQTTASRQRKRRSPAAHSAVADSRLNGPATEADESLKTSRPKFRKSKKDTAGSHASPLQAPGGDRLPVPSAVSPSEAKPSNSELALPLAERPRRSARSGR
jgi:hypothetical protein